MNKSVKKLLGTTCGIISVAAISSTSVYAQPDQGGPPNNGPSGKSSDFQRPNGGPETQGNGPPGGSPGGNYPDQGQQGIKPWQRRHLLPPEVLTPGVQSPQTQQDVPPEWLRQVGERQRPGQGQGDVHGPAPDHAPGQGTGNSGPGGRGPGGGGQGMSQEQGAQRRARMLKMFDKNGDGQLDENERAQMRAYMQQRRQQRMQREGQDGGGGGGRFGNGQPAGRENGLPE